MVQTEKIDEISKLFPMGSKVRLTGLSMSCAKVVGYHRLGTHVLVYNPELNGHCGSGSAYTDCHTPISDAYLRSKYGPHLSYFPETWMELVKKSAFAILKEEYGYE